MREPDSVGEMAAQAGLMSLGLGLGRRVDLWSLALTVSALVGLAWSARQSLPGPTMLLLVSVLAAAMQKVLALRVAFDEAVLRSWAESWQRNALGGGLTETSVLAELQAFDRRLVALGVLKQVIEPPRDWDGRMRGAVKLLGRQLMAFVLQFAALLIAVLAVLLPPSA